MLRQHVSKILSPAFIYFVLEVNNNGSSIFADTMSVMVVNDPQELNTITYKNLKWQYGDIYGTGSPSLSILKPDWMHLTYQPVETYLKIDSTSQWFKVPSNQAGISYWMDDVLGLYRLWIGTNPEDLSCVGKKIKH